MKSPDENTKSEQEHNQSDGQESGDLKTKRRQGRPLSGDMPLTKRIIFRLTESEFSELELMRDEGQEGNENGSCSKHLRPNIMAREFFIRGLRLVRDLNKFKDSPNTSDVNANKNKMKE